MALEEPTFKFKSCQVPAVCTHQSEPQLSYLQNRSISYPSSKELFVKAKCDNAYEVLSMCVGWNRCLCVYSSFQKWVLSTYYMPGTAVGTEDKTK